MLRRRLSAKPHRLRDLFEARLHAPATRASPLAPLIIRGRKLLPIVQGGMGVGVSAHRLAGSVARHGAVGTLSSVDLRRHHEDLMATTGGRVLDKEKIDAANL